MGRNKLVSELSDDERLLRNKQQRDRTRTKNGVINTIYGGQRGSSKKRGYAYPNYTQQELREWAFNQNVFHELYDKWVESGYKKDLKPSFDRDDDYGPYTLDSITIMTWRENSDKAHLDRLNGVNNKHNNAIKQYTLDNIYVREFHSMNEAARETGSNLNSIIRVCKGEYKQTDGFIYKYK